MKIWKILNHDLMKFSLFIAVHLTIILSLPLVIKEKIGDTPFIIPVGITLSVVGFISYILSSLYVSDFFDSKFHNSKSLWAQRIFFLVLTSLLLLWVCVPGFTAYTGVWASLFIFFGIMYIATFGMTLMMTSN